MPADEQANSISQVSHYKSTMQSVRLVLRQSKDHVCKYMKSLQVAHFQHQT